LKEDKKTTGIVIFNQEFNKTLSIICSGKTS